MDHSNDELLSTKKQGQRIRFSTRKLFAPRKPATLKIDWEIGIYGDLSDKQTELLDKFHEVPFGSKGLIYFDSCGGSVYTGFALVSLIQLKGLNATGVVLSECSSASLLPFAACKSRYVVPYATLLFHPVKWQSEDDLRLEEATEWARHFQSLESQVDQLLMKMFPVPLFVLENWSRPGRFVSGLEFAAAGLANLIDPLKGDLKSQLSI